MNPSNPEKQHITAVILAGGKARRMGGEDKGLCLFNGKPMIQYTLDKLDAQTSKIVINANRNQERYSRLGYEVFADDYANYCGPLAGIATAMRLCETPYLLCCPCDTPFLPDTLIERLSTSLLASKNPIAVAHNGERLQPVLAMMQTDIYPSLHQYLTDGHRKIDRWYSEIGFAETDFSDCADAFDNINTPEDIQRNEEKLQS